jgi:hypothetical protein
MLLGYVFEVVTMGRAVLENDALLVLFFVAV